MNLAVITNATNLQIPPEGIEEETKIHAKLTNQHKLRKIMRKNTSRDGFIDSMFMMTQPQQVKLVTTS